MVNLFTKKNKKADVGTDDTQVTRPQGSASSGATSARKGTTGKQTNPKEIDELPQLRDYPAAKREALFDQKLELCSNVFNFDDASSDKKEKEVKRQTLLELVDYVNTSAGQKIFTEPSMPVLLLCCISCID